ENKTYAYTVKAFYGYTMSGYYEDSLKCQFIKPEVELPPEGETEELYEMNFLPQISEEVAEVEATDVTEAN
ncbi:MAG: hypothetical protein IKT89_02640, partial [Clostridia bacterium]|nr:hypothetical protein [Clostridia bacterium]